MNLSVTSDTDFFNMLHVYWQLLDFCNLNCTYCEYPRSRERGIYVAERLITMLYRILEYPQKVYEIVFTGGEPAAHPLLLNLVERIYDSSPNVRVKIQTNGFENIEYYLQIASLAPKDKFGINIALHPGQTDVSAIEKLVSALSVNDIDMSFRLFDIHGIKYPDPFITFLNNLKHEQARIHIESSSCGKAWMSEICLHTSAEQLIFLDEHASEHCGIPTQTNRRSSNIWCCLGFNVLRIDSDGYYYGSLCGQKISDMPLWSIAPGALAPRIESCSKDVCAFEPDHILPKFREYEKAREWLENAVSPTFVPGVSTYGTAALRSVFTVAAGATAPQPTVSTENVQPRSLDDSSMTLQSYRQTVTAKCLTLIVYARNHATTLRKCLGSAIAQMDASMEIIVIDDASDDDTPLIFHECARQHQAIVRFLHFPEYRGRAASRNAALDLATGEYVAFADGDVILSPHFIADSLKLVDDEKNAYGCIRYNVGWPKRRVCDEIWGGCLYRNGSDGKIS